MIGKREMITIVITGAIVVVVTLYAINAVGLENGRLLSGELVGIFGYALFMTVMLFVVHLYGISVGDTPNTKVGLDEIGLFLGLAVLTCASIPLMIKFTRGIHITRRVLYIWISVSQLSLMAFLYVGLIR